MPEYMSSKMTVGQAELFPSGSPILGAGKECPEPARLDIAPLGARHSLGACNVYSVCRERKEHQAKPVSIIYHFGRPASVLKVLVSAWLFQLSYMHGRKQDN
jgi:hypothetical protein